MGLFISNLKQKLRGEGWGVERGGEGVGQGRAGRGRGKRGHESLLCHLLPNSARLYYDLPSLAVMISVPTAL